VTARSPRRIDVTPELPVTRYQRSIAGRFMHSGSGDMGGLFRRAQAILRPRRRRRAWSSLRRSPVSGSFRACVGIAGGFRRSGNAGSLSHREGRYPAPLCPGCEHGQRPGSWVRDPAFRRFTHGSRHEAGPVPGTALGTVEDGRCDTGSGQAVGGLWAL